MNRYNPFSDSSALVDEPISRRGSTVVAFLEPKECCPAYDDEAPRPASVVAAADAAPED